MNQAFFSLLIPAEASLAARLRGVMRKCGDSLQRVNMDVYTFASTCRAVSGARVSPDLFTCNFYVSEQCFYCPPTLKQKRGEICWCHCVVSNTRGQHKAEQCHETPPMICSSLPTLLLLPKIVFDASSKKRGATRRGWGGGVLRLP